MRLSRLTALLATFVVLFAGSMNAQQQQQAAKRKRLLVIGESKGFQHDSVSYAMAKLLNWGKETGLWDTYLRTDTQLITKKKLNGNAKNLDYFDAVAFYTTGELPMDEEQKTALMSFIKADGKGFVGMHSAPDTFYKWAEYGEMLGGWFDGHPWNTFEAPIIVEDRQHPATRHMPPSFTIRDEIYQLKNWSRDKVRVLMRLDESKLDLNVKNVKREDKDWAVTWTKSYGTGRVFYTSLGHVDESYDNPLIKQMFIEAIKWTLGLTEADTNSHPKTTATN
jgi:type 1 glutamine amidotransferase